LPAKGKSKPHAEKNIFVLKAHETRHGALIQILAAWIITLPLAAAVSAILWILMHKP
jgi:phosphate/sulfate permease